jgi:hypothetical protein
MTLKPIIGYEENYLIDEDGSIFPIKTGKKMNPFINKHGYLAIGLSKNGKQKRPRVHILVMAAFVGPIPKGLETRHLDGDKTNPKLSNLIYGTRQENWEDRRRLGELKSPWWSRKPRSGERDGWVAVRLSKKSAENFPG